MTETYVEIIDVITTNTAQQQPHNTPTTYIYYTPALRLFIIDILS